VQQNWNNIWNKIEPATLTLTAQFTKIFAAAEWLDSASDTPLLLMV
jgi:hypothetical protein